jgi:hypothetical protein
METKTYHMRNADHAESAEHQYEHRRAVSQRDPSRLGHVFEQQKHNA